VVTTAHVNLQDQRAAKRPEGTNDYLGSQCTRRSRYLHRANGEREPGTKERPSWLLGQVGEGDRELRWRRDASRGDRSADLKDGRRLDVSEGESDRCRGREAVGDRRQKRSSRRVPANDSLSTGSGGTKLRADRKRSGTKSQKDSRDCWSIRGGCAMQL